MIRVTPVRLIDDIGTQVGIVETSEALALAQSKGLDLVEISPTAKPPVCKIIDWGKFQYQEAKKLQEAKAKQKKIEIKGIRFRPATDEGDLAFKLKQAEKFLSKGSKVKVEIVLRGREKAFANQSREKLQKFIDKIEIPIKIEQGIKRQFNGFNVLISSNQAN
ncbi:translation initiation factor IF-3 [bacterium]|jgi:translation initiation factor IF-3|nr:translation initiation factor IF-3 [bacterium]MBT4251373.1 translation initiation factor IF-3 [bacterium]MBT4598246.1 translation initiation factor IF-3 [bacterium]MBT6754079.1 translation initiation factor IF-3 [bacterium]MBT7037899.1 translation initiation factor IF-3 [bacterium]